MTRNPAISCNGSDPREPSYAALIRLSGMRAAIAGVPASNNPFQSNSEARAIWARGHKQGAAATAEARS